MIRIPISLAELEREIENKKSGWLVKARKETVALRRIRDPNFQDMWGEIKEVYIRIQRSKCGFCEKPLEGRIEQDVEHFRPKKAVNPWIPSPTIRREMEQAGLKLIKPKNRQSGYKYLAYHPLNYVTACKSCNTIRKKNYFPVAGRYLVGGRDPVTLDAEQPYLIYPISDVDEDPEQIIEFSGLLPRPTMGLSAFQRLRSLVTIELFGLDDLNGRKGLFIDRIETLVTVYLALKGRTEFTSESDRVAAQTVINRYTSGQMRHTNCMRCYVRLFENDPTMAQSIYKAAIQYLQSVSR